MTTEIAALADLLGLFPPGSRVDPDGELVVGGCRLADLAATCGTPLYLIEEAAVRAQVDRMTGSGEFSRSPRRFSRPVGAVGLAFSTGWMDLPGIPVARFALKLLIPGPLRRSRELLPPLPCKFGFPVADTSPRMPERQWYAGTGEVWKKDR